jgi:hypothetical protein
MRAVLTPPSERGAQLDWFPIPEVPTLSLFKSLARFAGSPQGRRMAEKAMRYAQSPEGKRRIAQTRERLLTRRTRPR